MFIYMNIYLSSTSIYNIFTAGFKPLTKFTSRDQLPLQVDHSDLERVTPSEDNFDYEEQLVVLYNRVPKTGSTSFVNIAYDLCKLNRFHVLHINVTANMHVLSLPNQVRLHLNICT